MYIPKDEYAAALARDPMPPCRAAVLQSGAATEAQLAEIDSQYEVDIDDALKFAADSSVPELAEIDRDIYAQGASA